MKEATAVGPVYAPYLFVMLSKPSDGMQSWYWKQLLGCGIQKSDVRIVYMLNEPPAGSNGKGLKAQYRSARERFEREIKASKAKVVIPMGGDAFEALTGIDETIFDARGYVITKELFRPVPIEVFKEIGKYATSNKARGVTKGDPKMKWVKEAQDGLLGSKFEGYVIPTFTLDHIRTEAFAVKPAFKEDILRAKRAANDELNLIDKDLEYWADPATCIKNGKQVLRKKGFYAHTWGNVIAVDIETHGINNEVIDLVSFSDGKMTAAFEWNSTTLSCINDIFALPNKLFALHNSPFDLPRLVTNGVKIPEDAKFFDTMYGAVVIQPDLHKGLGRAATIYLDISPWKWRSLIDADQRFYSAKDAFVTVWLAIQQIAVMKSLGIWNLFTGEGDYPGPGVMATIPELTKMTEGGIRVDVEGATKWCAQLERKLLRYMKLWSRCFPEINPSSSQQLQKLFYKDWGLPVQETKNDGVSVNELALVKLGAFVEAQRGNINFPGDWHEDKRACQGTFDLLLKIRETKKILKTYVEPAMLTEQKWVHPQYLPVSKDDEKGGMKLGNKGNTATGRLVAYDPNICNQPKSVRWLYIPDQEDHCFIQADYKSAELYVLAGVSDDKKLYKDLQGDLHQANADRLGVDRKIAKNVTYACVPESAQALTRSGWKGPNDLVEGEDIMSYNPLTKKMDWSPLQAINRYDDAPLVKLSHGRGWSMVTTPNHRWWGYKNHITNRSDRREGARSYFSKETSFTTEEIGRNHCIMASGEFVGGAGLGLDILPKYDTNWSLAVLQMTIAERAAFLNGVIISDGHQDHLGRSQFTQKDSNHREAMTLAAILHGYRVAVTSRDDGRWIVHLCAKPHVGGQRLVKKEIENGPVWCPTVKEGYWLMRQNDTFTITGNSQYLASPSKQSEMILHQAHMYVSPAECLVIANGIWGYYTNATAYKQYLIALCNEKKMIRNAFGRIRFFHDGSAPAAVNYIPQSNTADVLWCIIKPIAEMCRKHKARLVTTVYDSILVSCPIKKRTIVAKEMKKIMERRFDNIAKGFFIPVEIESGEAGAPWGRLMKMEEV